MGILKGKDLPDHHDLSEALITQKSSMEAPAPEKQGGIKAMEGSSTANKAEGHWKMLLS